MNQININIQEPYLSFILNGQKTVEGRLNKGKFKTIKLGDILIINNLADKFKIVGKNIYPTFKAMIETEGLKNIIPDKKSIDEAVEVYYNFYTKDQEKEFGVLAIQINKI